MPEPQNYTGTAPQYIAPFEVVIHNAPDDCWVSFLGKVFDLTSLIKNYKDDPCIKPLVAEAGKDISHWFDEHTGDIRHYIHPVTGVRVPYCPHGRVPHVEIPIPSTQWRPLDGKPWWKDEKYLLGNLTKRVRPIRIINTLLAKEVQINVCSEDTFNRIMEKYSIFNSDASSYTWKNGERKIDMDKTMEENGLIDERDKFAELDLPQSFYIPSVLLYYNDDLKWEDE